MEQATLAENYLRKAGVDPLLSLAVEQAQANSGLTDEPAEEIIKRYKDPASTNRPDTLEDQLSALIDAGFSDVDCYYKNGIFAVFGGRK